MVVVFPMALVSVPLDSSSLIGACESGIVDSSNSYLFKVRVVLCPILWVNFGVVFLVVILRSGGSWCPNLIIIPSGCNDVREIVWL